MTNRKTESHGDNHKWWILLSSIVSVLITLGLALKNQNAQPSEQELSYQEGYFIGYAAGLQGEDPECLQYLDRLYEGCLDGHKSAKIIDLPFRGKKDPQAGLQKSVRPP